MIAEAGPKVRRGKMREIAMEILNRDNSSSVRVDEPKDSVDSGSDELIKKLKEARLKKMRIRSGD